MYDITRTRMLLTTVVFAAVAALFAAGANARIPADTDSAFAAQESLRIGAYASQPPSWRGKGGKGEETEGATNPLQRTGVARRDNQLDTAIGTAMATRRAKTVPLFTSGHQLDTAIGTAMATQAVATATQAVATAPAFPSGPQFDTPLGTARPCSPQQSLGSC